MKLIEINEIARILNPIGFAIGEWGQIVPISNGEHIAEYEYVCYQSPSDAKEMLSFSQHVVAWISGGDWIVFKSDYSTAFDIPDRCLIEQFLGIKGMAGPIKEDVAILMASEAQNFANSHIELECSFLIFLFLLVCGHAQIVSSKNIDGRYLSIQDGFVYFFARGGVDAAEILLRKFDANKLASATWIERLIREQQ